MRAGLSDGNSRVRRNGTLYPDEVPSSRLTDRVDVSDGSKWIGTKGP